MKTIHFGRTFKWLGVVFLVCLFFIGSLKAWEMAISKVIQNKKWSVTSLVYHRFGDERYPSTNTTIKAFEQQLQWLKQNDYTSVHASDVYRLTNKDEGKYVCITIDDGYKSFKQHGLPLLKKYGIKATLFVNTESVGWGDYLTWDEIKELQKDGIEIGNHSHNHAYFVDRPQADRLIYFESDLELSEKLFKKHLGAKPLVYAYPYGEFTKGMKGLMKTKGYKFVFAQNSGVWNETSDNYAIPRFPMSGNVSLKQFESKMQMHPFKVDHQPDAPILVTNSNEIRISLTFDVNQYPGPINCFVNGRSHEKIVISKGKVDILLKQPSKRRTLLTLTTRDKEAHWCWFSHLLIQPGMKE